MALGRGLLNNLSIAVLNTASLPVKGENETIDRGDTSTRFAPSTIVQWRSSGLDAVNVKLGFCLDEGLFMKKRSLCIIEMLAG